MDQETKANSEKYRKSLEKHIELELERSFETTEGFEELISKMEISKLDHKTAQELRDSSRRLEKKNTDWSDVKKDNLTQYVMLLEKHIELELERSFVTGQGFDKLISELKTFKRDPEAVQERQRYIKKLEEKISILLQFVLFLVNFVLFYW